MVPLPPPDGMLKCRPEAFSHYSHPSVLRASGHPLCEGVCPLNLGLERFWVEETAS